MKSARLVELEEGRDERAEARHPVGVGLRLQRQRRDRQHLPPRAARARRQRCQGALLRMAHGR